MRERERERERRGKLRRIGYLGRKVPTGKRGKGEKWGKTGRNWGNLGLPLGVCKKSSACCLYIIHYILQRRNVSKYNKMSDGTAVLM